IRSLGAACSAAVETVLNVLSKLMSHRLAPQVAILVPKREVGRSSAPDGFEVLAVPHPYLRKFRATAQVLESPEALAHANVVYAELVWPEGGQDGRSHWEGKAPGLHEDPYPSLGVRGTIQIGRKVANDGVE